MKSKTQVKALLDKVNGEFGKAIEHDEGQDAVYWITVVLRWVLSDSDMLGLYHYPNHYPEKS